MKLWCTNVPSSRHGGHLSPNLEQVSWINIHVNLKRNENGQENVYEKLKIYIFFNFRKSRGMFLCYSLRQVSLLLYEACFFATLWDRFLCCYMRNVSLLLFEAGFFAAIWGMFLCYSLRQVSNLLQRVAKKHASYSSKETCLKE
jgi:hypothetical protein